MWSARRTLCVCESRRARSATFSAIAAALSTPLSRCNAGLFPFWPELVENRVDWDEAGKNCPGIGGGPLIQIGRAMEVANEMRTAYPSHYEWK